ncbi:hypothetical protein Sjap_001844 [Stephania japonica]|uniref:Methyltransferase n=1 Tax=Stephania japonica TaxID=461633 RepID=A0AAP0KN16_9MAGN
MKTPNAMTPSFLVKLSAFALLTLSFFYMGKHWADGYQRLLFFNNRQFDQTLTLTVSPSPNANLSFNLPNDLLPTDHTLTALPPPIAIPAPSIPPPSLPPPPPPPPPPASPQRFGIVDENGTMVDEFLVGEFDPDLVEDWGNANETVSGGEQSGRSPREKVNKFELCPGSMSEYIPCLDNAEAVRKLGSTSKGENFERHCPEETQSLNCLIPAPPRYKSPIPWPRSRDEVWFFNVPHTRLVEDKGGQNWIKRVKDKFRFPGGGTQFIHGADQYLTQISQMVPDISFGHRVRVVLDVGCGVASFGAFLLSRRVITLSIAPKDVHENQIQFALERGVPAMVAAFATRRLLYPSQAFDLLHCSRCRINWTRDGGILLIEVNRVLRAGGYFVWAAQPVYKHEEPLQKQWKEMEDLTSRLCWKLVKKDGYIAIWRKPLDNECYEKRAVGSQPPLCDPNDDPDNVWYVDLNACISRLPENGYGANISQWPARLLDRPDRLETVQMDAYISKKDLYKADTKYWNEVLGGYIHAFKWKKLKLRNVMDMKAGFGGFAAALIDHQIDCWVMNIVPVSGPNTLPVIYDRGLIGAMHDWCEPFDTYPRTYDLLHAAGLLSIEKKRCSISKIMLEMDRILRPGGRVYFRDLITVIDEVEEIAKAMGWIAVRRDTAEGPYASWKLLLCEKRLLRSPK